MRAAPLFVLVAPWIALLGCAPKLPPNPPPHPASVQWQEQVDWEPAGDEAVEMLAQYLQIDTVNPPGNESRGARYLAALLARDGIETQLVGHAPGRDNLIARLRAADPVEDPLCLLSHIDVVPSERDRWPEATGPLSGVVDDKGVLWGRGALDMKGMGILEVHALSLLARLDVPLRRDVIVIAVADEEIGNLGMKYLVDEHWDELQCGHLINEGGYGVPDALFDGQTLHGVSVGEKGVVWLDVVATGEPGHGSTPKGNSSLDRLRAAINALAAHEDDPNWHPMILELLARSGAEGGGITGAVLRRPALVKSLARSKIQSEAVTWAMVTTTHHLTGVSGAISPNVVPSEVRATYDIRFQPPRTSDDVIAEVEEILSGIDGVSLELREVPMPATVSDYANDPFYEAIVAHALTDRERHVVGPILSPGFTDSAFARMKGTNAYGYVPFVLDQDVLETMHGDNERVTVEQIREGSRRLFGMVVQGAAKLDQAPRRPDRVRLVLDVPTAESVLAPPETEVQPPAE